MDQIEEKGSNENINDTLEDVKIIFDGNSKLIGELHKEFSMQSPGNLAYSPFGICSIMLSLMYATNEETSFEIQKSIFDREDFRITCTANSLPDDQKLYMGYSLTLDSYKTCATTTFNQSTRFFLKDDYFRIKRVFTSFMQDYGTSTEKINFKNVPEAIEKMNKWLAEASNYIMTSGITKNLYGEFADARIFIFNSFIPNATWAHKFSPFLNQSMKFHIDEEQSVDVTAMRCMAKFSLVDLKEHEAKAVILPFKDKRFKMIFVISNEPTELDEKVEQELCSMVPEEFLARGKKTWMFLHLPKFTIQSTLPMKNVLRKMGVTKAFEKSGNYKGMIELENDLWTNEIVHKTYIEVKEQGIGPGYGQPKNIDPKTSTGVPIITFRIDRPFYYQIIDQETNFILLAGRFNDPTENP